MADDTTPLLKVYDDGALTSFSKGIELVVAATLQSADFLYRTELGAPGQAGPEITLTPYEVASVLSFIFLGSAPDAGLYAAAQAGTLGTDQGVASEVDRLLGLPAVKERVTGLVTNIVGADQAMTSQRDAKVYPQLDTALRQAMADEMHDFVQTNVFGQHTLADLFTSRQALVNDKLGTVVWREPFGCGQRGAAADRSAIRHSDPRCHAAQLAHRITVGASRLVHRQQLPLSRSSSTAGQLAGRDFADTGPRSQRASGERAARLEADLLRLSLQLRFTRSRVRALRLHRAVPHRA